MTTKCTNIAVIEPPPTKGAQTQKGSMLVEFAFILPILLVVLFGVVSFSIALYNKTVLTMAAREGARTGALFIVDRTDTDIINNATDAANRVLQNNLISFGSDINGTVTPGISGDTLTVTTSVNYTGAFIMLDFSDFLISARTSMRIE